MRLFLLSGVMMTCCLGGLTAQTHQDSVAMQSLRKTTTAFLKKNAITSPNVNHITVKYVKDLGNANPQKKTIPAPKKLAMVDQKLLKGKVLTDDQWSGYVYNVSDDGTTFTYYTSCNVDPPVGPFTCASSAVVSLTASGLCRGFTQYYVVINQ